MGQTVNNLLNAWDEAVHWLHVAARVLWHAPLLKCPVCDGKAGSMSGGYEPEWSECWFCWDGWRWFDEYSLEWFAGRIHPLRWPWAKLAQKTGQRSFVGILLCRIGWHSWWSDQEYRYCRRCWESRPAAAPEHGEGGCATTQTGDDL